jgi:hypothetical protein
MVGSGRNMSGRKEKWPEDSGRGGVEIGKGVLN